jgi:exodeoxyribonuclease VII small subunit
MPKSSPPKPVEELSYEEAFAELDSTVNKLESGQLPLKEALNLFERGQALSKRCAELLDQAELKVRQLTGEEISDPSEALGQRPEEEA